MTTESFMKQQRTMLTAKFDMQLTSTSSIMYNHAVQITNTSKQHNNVSYKQ